MSFQAGIRQSGPVAVLDLCGEVNNLADEALQDAYEQAERAGAQAVVLNFGEVSYMNSSGIALVVSMLARARKTGRQVRAFGLSDHYREIFEITRLAEFVEIYPDEVSAIAGETPASAR